MRNCGFNLLVYIVPLDLLCKEILVSWELRFVMPHIFIKYGQVLKGKVDLFVNEISKRRAVRPWK